MATTCVVFSLMTGLPIAAQKLFHRALCDFTPACPKHYELNQDWILSANQWEMILTQQKVKISQTNDQTAHPLKPLSTGTIVLIQNSSNNFQHFKNGTNVVEVLPNRQYHVQIYGSGKITLRNRHHLWQIPSSMPTLIPTRSPNPTNDTTSPNPTNDITLNQTTNHPEVPQNITSDFQKKLFEHSQYTDTSNSLQMEEEMLS